MRLRSALVALSAGVFAAAILKAADVRTLTLAEAEELAVQRNPRISSAGLIAQAAGAAVPQIRSALYPTLTGNLTSVGADRDTVIAAGALQTSALTSRAATGFGFNQLVTDFGRTSSLADSARLRAAALHRNVATTRAQVVLQVDQAYYNALAARTVLSVAQATVDIRSLTLRQARALAESSLKSTLDVSFAEVALSEAELALYQAENAERASHALLSAAIGEEAGSEFNLVDVPLPARLTAEKEALVSEALKNRPELSAAKLNQTAAQRFAEAEKRLRYPAVSIVGVVGAIPFHQKNLASQYSAAGLNVSIPFLNGGLFGARRAEAEFRARGAEKDTQSLEIQVAADVRVAWLAADTAWRRIDVTTRLVDQAATSLRLAKTRYEIGLSGILELTQAQLAQTSAQIAAANAKYDYLTRLATLNYAIGAFR